MVVNLRFNKWQHPSLFLVKKHMDGMLPRLQELLEAKNIFVRNRKKRRTRSLGILLYHYGLSLRKCRSIVSSFEDISHESIRKWYHKVDTIFTVGKAYREVIAVDETKVKINGKLYILWAAIDISTWEILWCMGDKRSCVSWSVQLSEIRSEKMWEYSQDSRWWWSLVQACS